MLSVLAWVPKGASKAVPDQHELSQAEMDMLVKKGSEMNIDPDRVIAEDDVKMGGNDRKADPLAAFSGGQLDPELSKALDMDAYDDEEEGATMLLGGQTLTVHESNAEDPYIAVPDEQDESDEEDVGIRPTDNVLVVGKTEEEESVLQFQIYDDTTGSVYVHHEIYLPSFPLAMAWMNTAPVPLTAESKDGVRGSFIAVGSFEPGIEIWNLDVMDVMEPTTILGGRLEPDAEALAELQAANKKNKKKTKKMKEKLMNQFKNGSHTDAVMSLSWHPLHPFRLASGSADCSIKLWDITSQQCHNTFTHHKSKVQAMEWNPVEASVLLSGAYDRQVAVCDVRSEKSVHNFPVDADIESVTWHRGNPALFVASTESGMVVAYDVRRAGAQALFTLKAHNGATTAVSFNHQLPNVLATSSLDKSVKLWDLSENKPVCIASKEMQIGPIYCLRFCPDTPLILAAGGGKGKLAIWDVTREEGVQQRIHPAQGGRK